jgi:arylsulfatase A
MAPGDQPEFLPTRQGFDEYFGIPYSDDMTKDKRPESWPELPLMKDEAVIEAPVDRDYLTKRYTEEAIRWIKQKKAEPFFLYLPHAMPGSTTAAHASPAFQGRSANGKWGDSIEELDWSMGEILKVLKEEGLDENTLVVWTSDNGAPRRNPPQGSNAPYAGWGYNTSEGAMRMPCIVRWPGRLLAGVSCDALCSMMDLLPTFAGLAGAKLPEQKIDGRDMAGVWYALHHFALVHFFEGFVPLGDRPDAADDGFAHRTVRWRAGDDALPDGPVVAEAALQGDVFLHQRIDD